MPPGPEQAVVLQPPWLERLPVWLQHRNKVPVYSGKHGAPPRSGELDRDADRQRLVVFSQLELAASFEPGYALGPVVVGGSLANLNGLDLDGSIGEDGKVIESLKPFCVAMQKAGAMIEISRSGKGLHLVWLSRPDQTPPTFKRPGIECYTGKRFFARGSSLFATGSDRLLDLTSMVVGLLAGADAPAADVQPRGEASTLEVPQGDTGRSNYLYAQLVALHKANFSEDEQRTMIHALNEALPVPKPREEIEATVLKSVGKLRAPVIPDATSEFEAVEAPVVDDFLQDYDALRDKALAPDDWDIEGVLERRALTMLWGEAETWKSFVAIGMACSIASGTPWLGRAVKQGVVFYIAGEGRRGVLKRIRAWEIAHGVLIPPGLLHISAGAADMGDEAVTKRIVLKYRGLVAGGARPSRVFVDTLNRNFGGRDENQAKDIGLLLTQLSAVDRTVQAGTTIVHHANKEGEVYRGSTALRAGVDAEMSMERDGPTGRLTCRKMKDAEHFPTITLASRTIDLVDAQGVFVTSSLVLEQVPEPATDGDPLEAKIMDAMRRCGNQVSSKTHVLELVKGRKGVVLAKIRFLVETGKLESYGNHGLRLVEFGAVEEKPSIF